MSRLAKGKKKVDLVLEIEKLKCASCGKPKKEEDFYKSKSTIYQHIERLVTCKDCLDKEYEYLLKRFSNDEEKAVYYFCMKFDFPFSRSALDGAKKHCEKISSPKLHRMYIQKINSMGETNNYGTVFLEGERLEESDIAGQLIYVENGEEFQTVELEYLKIKWGSALPIDDLIWLEQKYTEWFDNYEIQGKSMDLLIQQLCFEEYYIYQERQVGKDVSKRLKTIQEMMKNSKLSPRQETASETAEFQTIAEFIKKAEQSKPQIKTNPEFEDPDRFKQMSQSLAGAIARTAGRPDENTKVFEEVFKEHTLDLSNLSEKDGG